MKLAQNSDAKTHMGKYNRTPRTDLSKKSLWDIFLNHPVVSITPIDRRLSKSENLCGVTFDY